MSPRHLKPKRKPKSCSTRVTEEQLFTSYEGIVAHYLANYADSADSELRFYRINERTLMLCNKPS